MFIGLLESYEHLDHASAIDQAFQRLANDGPYRWIGTGFHGVSRSGGGGEQVTGSNCPVLSCRLDWDDADDSKRRIAFLIEVLTVSDKRRPGGVDAHYVGLIGP